MKVLILLKSIDGGTGTFCLKLLKLRQVGRGKIIDISILCLERPAYRKVTENNVTYVGDSSLYPLTYSTAFRNIRRFVHDLVTLNREIRQRKPDLVMAIDIYCNIIALIIKKFGFCRWKLIINNRINLSDTLANKSSPLLTFLLNHVVRYLYAKADKIIAVSKGVRQDLKDKLHISYDIQIIPNGVALQQKSIRKPKNCQQILLSVGRLEPQKDYDTLLQAFVLIRRKFPSVKLIIAGDGSLRSKLAGIVRERGIDGSVILTGWSAIMDSYYEKADIFILSTMREGFPNALLEAMSHSLPVISTDAPYGPREMIGNNKYGLLVPVGDCRKMANAVSSLLKSNGMFRHYSIQSYQRASYYSLDKMLSHYKTLFYEVGK